MKRINLAVFLIFIFGAVFMAPMMLGSWEFEGEVTFIFYPDNDDWDYCYDDMYVEITGDMTDWDAETLWYDEDEDYFYITYDLEEGVYEFYFTICDEAIEDMEYYEGWFEPEADFYIEDGDGGYNAVVEIE